MGDLLNVDFAVAEKNTLYKRSDCRQVVIGLIVTPEEFPLSYEVLAGNTADSTTLSDFLKRIALTRDQLLIKLGAAKHEAGCATHLIELNIPTAGTPITSFRFQLNRNKLKQLRRREGRYLLRPNLGAHDPHRLWTFCVQLTEVEQAFKELKHDLALRPIYHSSEPRIEAHIFVAFHAYCL